MKINKTDRSEIHLSESKFDSSNKKVYKMTCKSCGKDRGYKRPAARKLACMSCGQKGKVSGNKGTVLTQEQKLNISKANIKWRQKQDPTYRPLSKEDSKILHNVRCRLWLAVKNKSHSMTQELGCKNYELREYLESKFEDWMTWDNYGSEWEIDHVIPLSKVDLNNSDDFKKVCHYTNLMPMSISKNRSKGAKYDE